MTLGEGICVKNTCFTVGEDDMERFGKAPIICNAGNKVFGLGCNQYGPLEAVRVLSKKNGDPKK